MTKPAQAFYELGVGAAGSFNGSNYGMIKSPGWDASAELLAETALLFELGAFYDRNFLSYNGGTSGSLKFYGPMARFGFILGPFIDVKAGLDSRDGSNNSFGWGVAGGYRIPIIPFVIDFCPRVGYRYVPDHATQRSLLDLGFVVSFKTF